MKRFVMLVTVAFAVIAFGQEGSTTVKRSPAGQSKTTAPVKNKTETAKKLDTLIVTARLEEIPGKMPPNDLYNYVYIMKYRVLSVQKGTYEGKEILVGHYNPLVPRAQVKDKMAAFVKGNVTKFEQGSKQKLWLVTPIEKVWKDAVEDEYFDYELPKYFALKVTSEK